MVTINSKKNGGGGGGGSIRAWAMELGHPESPPPGPGLGPWSAGPSALTAPWRTFREKNAVCVPPLLECSLK